jgi:hypothetical protein
MVVSHLSTKQAQTGLTSQIGPDGVRYRCNDLIDILCPLRHLCYCSVFFRRDDLRLLMYDETHIIDFRIMLRFYLASAVFLLRLLLVKSIIIHHCL